MSEELKKNNDLIRTIVGILIIALIFGGAIFGFVYFAKENIHDEKPLINETNVTFICNNLDNGMAVFPEIMKIRKEIENNLEMNMITMFGNTTSARMWDKDGVMCDMDVEMCQKQYLFCMHVTAVIPVNYTEWKNWFYKNDSVIIQPESIKELEKR